MKEEKRPAEDLILATTAILAMAGLFIGGGIGLIIGSSMERTVPVALFCGFIGLAGGALAGYFIAARDQKNTNGHCPL